MAAIQRRALNARRAVGLSPATQTAMTVLLLSLIAVTLFLVLGWNAPTSSRVRIAPGQVAPFDIVAPRQTTYASELLTEQARQRAAAAVPEQYDIAAGSIRRQQVVRSREITSLVDAIRQNPALSEAERLDALLAIPELGLTAEAAVDILALSEEDWAQSAQELPGALDRLLRDEIRQTDLPATQRRAPTVVSADLSEAAAEVTAALVRALARPNSFPNPDRTAELREDARAAISPLSVTIERGEIILRAGDVATPEDVEALQQIGIVSSEWDRQTLLRALAYTALILALAVGAWIRLEMPARPPLRQLGILTLLVVSWLVAAKFMIVSDDWIPLLFPLAALTMLIACLVDVRAAVIVTVAMAMVVHWLGSGNALLVIYSLAGGLAGALVLGRAERLSVFIWAALAVMLANTLALTAFLLPFEAMSTSERVRQIFAGPLNGGLSASVALLGYFALGNLFGLTTSLQLNELSRPTHPLLRQLLLKASGTYHHSIVVSNLAERAASAIGADALLARVGAYYHDIGKTVRPYFFTENSDEDASPHDRLDPQTSAQIIISHVRDGVDLAQKYRLPHRLQDFITEHHGRSLVQYFYVRAVREAGSAEEVDEEAFHYPGPRPQSKETAILALADTCEAAVRAMRPASREELATLVNRLIDERVTEGEIDESPLTHADVKVIRNVFVQVLQGVHHPRIVYPGADTAADSAAAVPSTTDLASASTIGAASAIHAERNAVQGTLVTDQSRTLRRDTSVDAVGSRSTSADSTRTEPNGAGHAGAEELDESAAMASVDKAG